MTSARPACPQAGDAGRARDAPFASLETQRRERIRVKVRKWRSQHITGRIDVQSGRYHLRGSLTYRLLRHARLVVVSGEEGVPAEQVGKAPYGSYDLGVCRKDRSKHALCLFDCLRRPVRSIGRASDFRRGWTRPLRLCCGVMVLSSAFLMGMAERARVVVAMWHVGCGAAARRPHL